MTTDTIFAPITGRGGAVTVLRISGPLALAITEKLTNGLPNPRHASLRKLRHQGQVLDHALVTIFPGPQSFTGEDSAELALHGGRAVLSAVSAALTAQGARYAEPGEFSRRAFGNGRMNLLEAEAMADLIAAETEAQRRLAVEGGDALQSACQRWREALRQAMAQQEALIDFPDEDLPPEVEAALLARISGLRGEMLAALAGAPAAERLREGLEFVILGPPNAGKSTLLNALAGEEIAIVSEIPGTTRDAVGSRIDLGGVPVHLTDTAGLRETEDRLEAEGIRRARVRAGKADLIIAVAAAPNPVFPETPDRRRSHPRHHQSGSDRNIRARRSGGFRRHGAGNANLRHASRRGGREPDRHQRCRRTQPAPGRSPACATRQRRWSAPWRSTNRSCAAKNCAAAAHELGKADGRDWGRGNFGRGFFGVLYRRSRRKNSRSF